MPGGEASPPPIPAYRLFNADSVGLATFLGTPIAGGILMAVNYRRLGKGGKAAAVLLIALLVTALALVFGYLVPQGVSALVAVGLFLGARTAAKALQGAAVEQHVRQGGKLGSKWAAAGLGIALLAIVVGGYLLVYSALNPKVQIGTKDEVYYSGSATQQDAQKLGAALKTTGFLSDRGASVFLSKGNGGTVVSFVVKEGIWNDPAMVASFEEIGRQIAPSVGGFPIQVRLIDSARAVKKEVTAGKAIIGTKDEIYYFGSATEADAKALGQALQTAGFFRDAGFSVLLSKGDATVIGFVVREGLWDQPENVATFEKIARQVASSAGGLPIKLRLLNNTMETKKEVAVQ